MLRNALLAVSLVALATPVPRLAAAASRAPAMDDSQPAEPDRLADAVKIGIERIIAMQEGDDRAEWPYEGVVRVQGKIPIGYRVGGTAIAGLAVLQAPGYADEPAGDKGEAGPRHTAVRRAAEFVAAGIKQPLMSYENFDDVRYDTRGWGYIYGIHFFLQLKDSHAVPAGLDDQVETAIKFYVTAIHRTEIPQVGGWNYSRPAGRDKPSPPSPFMTSPTLQALFEARKHGYSVDEAMVTRALDAMDRGRTPAGGMAYSVPLQGRSTREAVPGAVGRMLATETTLYLAGRSSVANIRGAVDAFIVHWEWLNKRRAKPGTHEGPYAIAPYYFYYAHYYAAQAVELLPKGEQAEYRRRINDLLFATRAEDGSWNDRVFPRTANFGTSMAVMAMLMPQLPRPALWKPGDAAPAPAAESKSATDAAGH